MKNDLMVVKQLPVIEEQFKQINAEIKKKTNGVKKLVVIGDMKKLRAELNNEFKDYEKQRKTVKAAINERYESLNEKYKQYIATPFEEAEQFLKEKIDKAEQMEKDKTKEEAKKYFLKKIKETNIDFISFEQLNLKIILATKIKDLEKEIDDFLSQVESDMRLINSQEHSGEIMLEYKENLNVSKSVEAVILRKEKLKKIEEEKQQEQKEQTQESQQQVDVKKQEPTETAETIIFKVTAPKLKIVELKKFLRDNEYEVLIKNE